MRLSYSVPQSVAEAGLPSVYRYLSGHSGRRYLFTRIEAPTLGEYEDAVAVAVKGDEIVWVGEARSESAADRSAACEVFVHLLAATSSARRAIVEDFATAAAPHLRLAA